MTRGRDTQKSKLYRSEHAVFKHAIDFNTIRQAQKYANSITGSRWWRALGGPTFVLIKQARSDAYSSTAWAQRNEIRLDGSTFMRWVLIHELTHIVMWHLNRALPAHGPDYALVYLRVIEQFLGDEQRQALSVAFESKGVKVHTDSSSVLKGLAAAGDTRL